ncbi:uncharacterized protein C8R40DRAFT_1125250 [Lentinula edodes]|uniref:uncharacterized protein n=1 Tax=Lentinula edodes TaxID=5353 RepID=UPI001E8CC371|nr:uncharacterized protein C8R40DRAFT_1125250 [Lentinula edodes]KAH7870821.1 hypothetical protein C8R40DRAFT_1125250 [Lentinula edodes]
MDAHPTDHPLQPHQVGLLVIFILTFKDLPAKNFDSEFLLYLLRMLLDEVSELTQPKSFRELRDVLSAAPKSDEGDARALISTLKAFKLETTDQMINFFSGLPMLFQEKDEGTEGPESILGRRSIFGFYCRRCYISFGKLSFSGVTQFHKELLLWIDGKPNKAYKSTHKDELNSTDSQIFQTQGDRQNWAQPEAYASWIKGQTIGDETLAKESLRSFFEQRFHEGNDSGVRQLGLLNLVRYHYIHEEYSAGRKLLSEAINVSRNSGDKITLQQCISLLRRFPSVNERPPINEVQPNLNPLDILYDVKKLMDETNEQPLSASFLKIAESLGVFDLWCDTNMNTTKESDQWAQHTVQAIVWNAAGCENIGDIEADVAVAFTSAGSSDNNRLTALLNTAYRRARQGNYDNALAILLNPVVWKGLTLPDYKIWAQEVWQVLALRASRRGQDRLYRDFLLPRQPPGERNMRHYVYIPRSRSVPIGKISNPLHELLRLRECEASAIMTEQLLKSIWHSEFLFRIHHYRIAVILLADAGLQLGLSQSSQKMIEDIMPQIVTGNDIEIRAFAAFTVARCIIAAGHSVSGLQHAAWWLVIAEKDYMALQLYRSVLDVQYLLAVVYNSMGAEQERDASAQRFKTTQQLVENLEASVADAETGAILDMVSRVGILEFEGSNKLEA